MSGKKINETLSELITGIIVVGLVIQAADLLISFLHPQFISSIGRFALGFWIGIVTAVGLSVHMYRSIDRALDMQPDDAEKYMRKAYLLRTGVILAVAGVVNFLKFGYVMAYFLGVLCLKFGAFLQPLVHRLRSKLRKQ